MRSFSLRLLSVLTASATLAGYTHTAPVVRSLGLKPIDLARSSRSGWAALKQRRCTLEGVSSPARVVRSMQEMARSCQASWCSFLTARRAANSDARFLMADKLRWTFNNVSSDLNFRIKVLYFGCVVV